jgi:nitroreductase
VKPGGDAASTARAAAIDALLSRRSVPAQCLTGPGPDAAQVATAVDVALRAPDHGRMQPWRFRIIRGAARTRFSEALVAAARAREPALAPAQLEKLRTRPLQVPLVIVVSARLRDNPKVPHIEQLLSSGAAVMNLLNAFHAQGFGAVWLTGPSAYDPAVAAALGLGGDEQLLGFVHVGTIGAVVPAAPERPAQAAFVSEL